MDSYQITGTITLPTTVIAEAAGALHDALIEHHGDRYPHLVAPTRLADVLAAALFQETNPNTSVWVTVNGATISYRFDGDAVDDITPYVDALQGYASGSLDCEDLETGEKWAEVFPDNR